MRESSRIVNGALYDPCPGVAHRSDDVFEDDWWDPGNVVSDVAASPPPITSADAPLPPV